MSHDPSHVGLTITKRDAATGAVKEVIQTTLVPADQNEEQHDGD